MSPLTLVDGRPPVMRLSGLHCNTIFWQFGTGLLFGPPIPVVCKYVCLFVGSYVTLLVGDTIPSMGVFAQFLFISSPCFGRFSGVWTFRTIDYSYHGLFVPRVDHSYHGPFVPWTFRTTDYSYHRLFVPWTVRTIDLLYHLYNLLSLSTSSSIWSSNVEALRQQTDFTEEVPSWRFPGVLAGSSDCSDKTSCLYK